MQEEALAARGREVEALHAQVAEAGEARAAAERTAKSLMPLELVVSDLRQRLTAATHARARGQARACLRLPAPAYAWRAHAGSLLWKLLQRSCAYAFRMLGLCVFLYT